MKHLYLILVVLSLAACGSTSGIKTAEGEKSDLDLSSYENVVVQNFTDGTKKSNLPDFMGNDFADMIAANIKEQGVFSQVSRDSLDGKSIVISGAITKYKEGSAPLKLLIGFGAGSSHFDADVKISDSETNTELGKVIVDKKSWALGGIMAATQTVKGFMSGAAKKIAKEVAEAKKAPGDEIAKSE
ncbi:MAG: DUF4410 domain-containing protein [Chlorobium sp.]|nr:DUF4410 domain-containing protein [Chlorobium sp.]MCW8814601.1 DUF4410 domain-containing protein [Chlorobium sp.]MCW8820370.1 DUF4410 domain-containing protein [Ignavibacteriaceae bacterium]